MTQADVTSLDRRTIMALLMGIIRVERFCDGAYWNSADRVVFTMRLWMIVVRCLNSGSIRVKEMIKIISWHA